MKKSSGFTIIELVVTLSVLAIIAAFAAPSFTGLMRSIRVDGDLSSVRNALTYARAEAVNAQEFVTVCTSDNPAAANASLACTEEVDWASGWIVFLDANDNQEFDAANDELLRVWETPLSASATLVDENDRTSVTFDDEGMVSGNSAVLKLALTVSGCEGTQQRIIETTLIGRLDISAGACP